MKEKQSGEDRHLNVPSDANSEKHMNFPGVGRDSSKDNAVNKGTSDRQEQWQRRIEEGEREKNRSKDQPGSSMLMDDDDTIGVP